jgi:hypothetical protein
MIVEGTGNLSVFPAVSQDEEVKGVGSLFLQTVTAIGGRS